MKKILLSLTLLASSLALSPAAFAQTATTPDPLYKAFGEKAGLVVLMDDFMIRLLADPRTGPHFQPADQAHVKAGLVEQLCAVSGGPCVYKGPDMKVAHSNLDITKGDFNALVEVLQKSMDAKGIPFTQQNQMLARLAPMHRDIITVR